MIINNKKQKNQIHLRINLISIAYNMISEIMGIKNPSLKRNGLYNHCKVCSYHTLISTSTPEGSSNFIRASTVLEEEE